MTSNSPKFSEQQWKDFLSHLETFSRPIYVDIKDEVNKDKDKIVELSISLFNSSYYRAISFSSLSSKERTDEIMRDCFYYILKKLPSDILNSDWMEITLYRP